jgi:hypothetical protein
MKTLGLNWITENLIDLEYKKYILLDYIQYINLNFGENKLYPFVSDLITHHQNLLNIKDVKSTLKLGDIESIDLTNLKFDRKLEDDKSIMKEVEDIVDYSIPIFKKSILDARDIYELVECNLSITPVGIVPLYKNIGYFFLLCRESIKVYEYELGIFEKSDEVYRGIHSDYLSEYDVMSCDKIKLDIIMKNKKLPNPATYLIESKLSIPLEETFLPISKRLLLKYIST